MKKIILILASILVLLAPGCKKPESAPQTSVEPRWLRIYHDGKFLDSIDVTGWEKNEDVVELGEYGECYPWQGEDSINYRFENSYLWVNGKKVGVNLGIREIKAADVKNPEEIITAHVSWGNIADLKFFPNLTCVKLTLIYWRNNFPKEELSQALGHIPENVDVYVRTFAYGDYAFNEPNIPDFVLEMVSRIPNLEGLLVNSNQITDFGMSQLSRCKDLHKLDLSAPRVTDRGLECLRDLSALRELKLSVDLTDKGLKHLAGLANLRDLDLYGESITDAGLKYLKGLRNLRDLNLSYTQVRGAGLRYLSGLRKLNSLELSFTPIRGYGLHYLASLPSLKYLNLGGSKVDDAGLKYIRGLTQLEELALDYSAVTDTGLGYLADFKHLKVLYVWSNKLSPFSFDSLRSALPDCKVY